MESNTLVSNQTSHQGFDRLFAENHLTIGFILPLESDRGAVPTMENHAALVQKVDELGFAGLWVRDVPLHDPNFGDVGQIFDPFVYLKYLSAITSNISLVTGSIVLPLRHPLQVAKAAASVDRPSSGRLVLGIASGDRPIEFPAFDVDFDTRGDTFRESLSTARNWGLYLSKGAFANEPPLFAEPALFLVKPDSTLFHVAIAMA